MLTGVKPTGAPHIGNYFGAMRPFVELTKDGAYEPFFFIADYHALNFIQNGKEMATLTNNLALDYLAVGLDPRTTTIYQQSMVPAHTELAWIFDTITTMPYLMRAHAFKDAEAKNKEISVGTFNYPMLMAADILLYDPQVVPVGQDQKQHIEYARDTAEKFNRIFGETFTLPEAHIQEAVAVVPGTDGRKMSKSYQNTIPLFATREEIVASVMSIVTDSSGEKPENVYALHALFKEKSALDAIYESHRGKYKELKETLIEDMDAFIAPMRKKRAEAAQDPFFIRTMLQEGAARASDIAEKKMQLVRERIGVRTR